MRSCLVRPWSGSFHRRGRVLDRRANLVVGSAAADVAAHGLVDVGVARRAVLRDERSRAHDLAGLAIAALRHVILDPRGLDRLAGGGRRNTLYRSDLLTHRLRHWRHARAHRLTVKVNGARTALRDAAAELGSGEVQGVAQDPKDGRLGRDVELALPAVDR